MTYLAIILFYNIPRNNPKVHSFSAKSPVKYEASFFQPIFHPPPLQPPHQIHPAPFPRFLCILHKFPVHLVCKTAKTKFKMPNIHYQCHEMQPPGWKALEKSGRCAIILLFQYMERGNGVTCTNVQCDSIFCLSRHLSLGAQIMPGADADCLGESIEMRVPV